MMAEAMLTEEKIQESLRGIKEVLRGKDIVTLGMIKKIEIQGTRIVVMVELPTPVYRDKKALREQIRSKIEELGATSVDVVMVEKTLPGHRGLATRLASVKNIIAVAAGKGGVGKSTIATNLALSLHLQGAKVGLLDADIYGPSVPTMLGPPEIPPGTQVGQKISPAVHHGIHVISIGFFTDREGAVVWRGPMIHIILQQFLEDVEWGDLDYLVVDLPPGTGDAQLSLSQLIPITGAVMVTTPQEVALIDVEKAVSMFQKVEVPLLGVIENMSYYICPNCGHQDEIFSRGGGRQLADSLGTQFFGEIPLDSRIRYGGDVGEPVVIGQPNGEHSKAFLEIGLKVSEAILKMVSAGPKRPAGLVQIR